MNEYQARTLLFVHVPKTAGTALRVLFEKEYFGQPAFTIHHLIPEERVRLETTADGEKRTFRYVFGHMTWGWHRLLAPGQPYAYLTMLREPVERVLSLFAHCRLPEHYLGKASQGMDLATWLTSDVSRTGDNGMVRQLCGRDRFLRKPYNDMLIPLGGVTQDDLADAKRHLDECAVVGVAEEFPMFLARMRELFGWRSTVYQHVNVTRWPRMKRAELDKKTAAVVEGCTALDRELYEYAVTLSGGQG